MELAYSGSGYIIFQDKEYRCNLYLNEEEGIIQLNIQVDIALASSNELPYEINYLIGKLDNGFCFSVFGCSQKDVIGSFSADFSIFTYYARSLLKGVGINNPDGIKLYKVQFALADILRWGTFSGFKVGKNYEISTDNPINIRLYEDEKITIRYLVTTTMLPFVQFELLNDKIDLSQKGIIEIEFAESETIDYFERYYKKIKHLIEISMRKTIRLTEIIGWSHNFYLSKPSDYIESPISIMNSDITKTNYKTNDIFERWEYIFLPDYIENNSFKLYMEKYNKLAPIIELYIESFNQNGISPKRLFLNLVQGLETYHSRFITNDIDMFKKRVTDDLLKDRPMEYRSADYSFLMANSHKFITLESRIADLLTAGFEIVFDTGDIQYEDFPEIVANTRNYLVHYDDKIKQNKRVMTEDEIQIYNITLHTIFEFYLLRELGFKDSCAIKEKLDKRWGSISKKLSNIKVSKEKHKMLTVSKIDI